MTTFGRGEDAVQMGQPGRADHADEPVGDRFGSLHLDAFYGSVDPAIWSFQLALRARGLGTTVTGYHLNGHEADVAELLSIPPDVTRIAMLPVAYTTTTEFRPAVEDIQRALRTEG
jgi:nitroreductase